MKQKISQIDYKNFEVPSSIFEILKKMKTTQINEKVDYLMIKYKMLEMLKSIKA